MSKTEEKTHLLQPEGASGVPDHPPAYSSIGQHIVVQQPAGFQGQQQQPAAAAAAGGYAQPTFYQGKQQQLAPAGYAQPTFYQGQQQPAPAGYVRPGSYVQIQPAMGHGYSTASQPVVLTQPVAEPNPGVRRLFFISQNMSFEENNVKHHPCLSS